MSVGQSVCLSVCRSASNEFYRSVMLLVVYICCYYYCSLDHQIILWLYFAFLSCDSSSIGHNVSLSVCLSATCFIEVLCCSVRLLLLLLQLIIFEHSVGYILHCAFIFCILSCECSSRGHNISLSVCLSATSSMEVLCFCLCSIVVTVVVVYNISTLCCYIFHFAFIFCIFSCERNSIGHYVSLSVCLSVSSFMEVLCCC